MADTKVSALGTVVPIKTDVLYVVDNPTGTPVSGKATIENVVSPLIGDTVQAYDATLTSIAALGTAADKIAYTTGVDTWAEAAITSFGRSLIDDADASAARTTLGVDAAGTDNSTNVTIAAGLDYITISGQELTLGDITIDDMADMATDSFLGRTTAATGPVEVLSKADALAILNVEDGATADQSNAEIETAYNAQVSVVSQGDAEAGTSSTVYRWTPLRVAQAIAALAAGGLQNNYVATTDPGATDDTNAGYSVGSVWINTTSDESFKCADNTASAAVWVKTSLTTDELATVAVSGDSDDLTEGATKLLLTSAERSKLSGIEALADVTDSTNVAAALATLGYDADLATMSLPASTTISAFGATLVDDADAATARTTLGLAIGTDVQAYDADTMKTDVAQTMTAQLTVKETAETVYTLTGTDVDPANGTIQKKTETGSATLTGNNFAAGQSVTLILTAPTAVTFTGFNWITSDGSGPTLGSNNDTFVLYYDGTTKFVTYVGNDG